MEEKRLVKCERCGRIRDLFQYSKFEVKIVEMVVDNGTSANPQFTIQKEDLGEKRGLCEECAVIVNSRAYDASPSGTPLPIK